MSTSLVYDSQFPLLVGCSWSKLSRPVFHFYFVFTQAELDGALYKPAAEYLGHCNAAGRGAGKDM